MANDCSALADELKLREDNSDPIKVHPELNSARDQNFSKNVSRKHAKPPNILLNHLSTWPQSHRFSYLCHYFSIPKFLKFRKRKLVI